METPSFNQTYASQMKIEKAVVEEPVFKNTQAINFTSGGLSFTFPSSIPFIGGSKMSLDLPFLTGQLAIDPSGYIQFGLRPQFPERGTELEIRKPEGYAAAHGRRGQARAARRERRRQPRL